MNQHIREWVVNHPIGSITLGVVLDERHVGGFCVDLGSSIEGHVDILNFHRNGRKIETVDDYPAPGNVVRCEVLGASDITSQVHLGMLDGDEWSDVQVAELTVSFGTSGIVDGGEASEINSMLRNGYEVILFEKCSGVYIPRDSGTAEIAMRLCGTKFEFFLGKRNAGRATDAVDNKPSQSGFAKAFET